MASRLCAPLSFEVKGKAVDDAVANLGLIQGNTLKAIASIVDGGAKGYALMRLRANNRRLNYQPPTQVVVAPPPLQGAYPYGYNPYYTGAYYPYPSFYPQMPAAGANPNVQAGNRPAGAGGGQGQGSNQQG